MASKLRLRVFVVFSQLASAAGCGQVADLGNNGSGGAGAGASDDSTGGTVANTGGETGGRDPATGGVTDTGGARPIPPDDACVAGVLTANACLACHSVASAAVIGAGLVLEGSNLGARLSATQATYKGVTVNAASCVPGALIIDPVSPADSILLRT
jgi:hypothetical protein